MIPGIVLAAGKSSRMGRMKPLLPLGDHDIFLTRVVRTLHQAGVSDVTVVVGASPELVRAAIARYEMQVRVVVNPDFERGQLSSLKTGLRAIDHPEVVAALVTLIDVPLVGAETVRSIVAAYRDSDALIVRPMSGERHGHPVIFDRALFPELLDADEDEGAKPVVHAHAAHQLNVEIEDEGAFVDIDTPDDYARYISRVLPKFE